MKIIKIISLLIISITISGCQSILSDRSKCPCYFTIDFSTLGDDIKYLNIWIVDAQNEVIHNDYILADDYKEFYEVLVPRGYLKVHIWGNAGINTTIDHLKSGNTSLTITQNKVDSLFSDTKEINTNQEIARDTIRVRPEFATLNVEVLNADVEDSLKIIINNTTKGFYINRGQISPLGELTPSGINTKNGITFSCSILRQKDMLEDLTLSIYGEKNGTKYKFQTYPLGKKLIENGYDMSATRLYPITITFNSALSLIKLNTLDWEYINNQQITL